MHKIRLFIISLLACACMTTAAQAAQIVQLHTAFTPDKLGEPTTISFSFTIKNTNGGVPSPLTDVNLHLPAGMNPATATIGDGQCKTPMLLLLGLKGCPPNSQVGGGTALAEVILGSEAIRENAQITVLNGTPEGEHLVLLFYADGETPVSTQLVFPSVIFLNEEGPFSGHINTNVPPIPSVPGAPDVSVLSFQSTLGPLGVTYYRLVHGRRVAFHPEGIAVPESCPHQGFLFSGEFSFMDGTVVKANSTVPCPPRKQRHHS